MPAGALLAELISRFSQAKPAPAAAPIGEATPQAQFLRQVIKASLAQDERGSRLREAWRMVGHGLLLILRELADQAPDSQAP